MSPRKPHRRASSGPTASGPAADAGTGEVRAAAARAGVPRRAPAPTEASALAAKASEDDPRVWGDSPEDRDSWLLEQRPPHWD